MVGLPGQLVDDGQPEDEVGGEQPQVAFGGVVVVHGDLEHQPVQRQRAGVVGDDERPAVRRDVLDALHLHAEVLLREGPQQRHEDLVGQLLVVAELVHLVVAGDAPPQEGQTAREPPLPVTAPGVPRWVRGLVRLLRPLGRFRTAVPLSGHLGPRQGAHGCRGALGPPGGRTGVRTGAGPAAGGTGPAPARGPGPVVVEGNDLGVRHRRCAPLPGAVRRLGRRRDRRRRPPCGCGVPGRRAAGPRGGRPRGRPSSAAAARGRGSGRTPRRSPPW